MSETSDKRECLRCKLTKPLTVGNYRKRAPYLNFEPLFDIICRKCRDTQANKDRVQRPKYHRACKQCDVEYVARRSSSMFCSAKCKLKFRRKDEQDRRVSALKANKAKPKKEIDQKWLVRGRIHGVHY